MASLALLAFSVFVLAPASTAHADWRSWRGAAGIDFFARAGTTEPPPEEADRVYQGAAGVALRAVTGKKYLLLAVGADFELGAEVPADFVYGLHILPLGLAVPLGSRSYLGVMAGGGFGGGIERVPFAWELPVEAFAELDLGAHVRVHLGARATWTPGDDRRGLGDRLVDVGDQLDLRAGFSFGTRHEQYRASWGDFTYVGAFLREQGGERIVGAVLALAIGMGGRP